MIGLSFALYLALGVSATLFTLAFVYFLPPVYRLFRPRSAPPLVSGWIPFIGCWYPFWKNPVKFLEEQREIHGDIFSVMMGGVEHTWVFDTELFKDLFKAPEKEMSMLKAILARGIMVPLIGESLPTSREAVEHALKSRHDVIMTFKRTFAPRQKGIADDFSEVLHEYLEQINAGETGVLQSRKFVIELALRMGTLAVCGKELSRDDEFRKIVGTFSHCFDVAEGTTLFGWLPLWYTHINMHKVIREKLTPVIRERIRWAKQNPQNSKTGQGWITEHNCNDLMSVYMDGLVKNKHDDDYIVKMVIMVCTNALFGTVANLPWTIEGTLAYILSDEKLYTDVKEDIAVGFSTPAEAHMPFLDACFEEYIRMWPVISISRYITGSRPYQLTKNVFARPQTLVDVCPRISMREERYFPEPDKFNPYRIYDPVTGDTTPELQQARKDQVHMPFGHGRHACAGVKISYSSMKVCLGVLIRAYHLEMLEPFPGTKYIMTNTAQLAKPVQIRYTKRTAPLGAGVAPMSG